MPKRAEFNNRCFYQGPLFNFRLQRLGNELKPIGTVIGDAMF